MSASRPRFNKDAWERFKRAVHSFRHSEAGRKAIRLFTLLLTLLLGINGLNVVNSYVGRDFISSIEHKDWEAFARQSWMYIGVFGLSTLFMVLARYAEESLGLVWRDWQTRHMIDSYLKERAYYQLEQTDEVENPDQRISEDIRTFTTTTLSFVVMMLNAGITAVAFSTVLWAISPKLFLVAVAYAGAGSALTVLLGRPLVGLNDRQLDKEANFRTELIHLRENAETLAMLNSEKSLRLRLDGRLNNLITNAWRMVKVNRNLGFFTTGYNFMIQIIPALIVAPMFIKGQVEFGVITQSAMAFSQLMGAFSFIVTQFQSISSYAAVIVRLGRLTDAMDHICTSERSPIHIEYEPGRLVYDDLTLETSEGQPLIQNLKLEIRPGARTLIRGVSGDAKAALFKATAGLSCDGHGRILRPSPEGMHFLPERPYLPKDTLRHLLSSASGELKPADDEIAAVLHQLHLESLVEHVGGYDVEYEWGGTALNEQSMIMVARTLLYPPEFLFMDRLSIAFDARQSAQLLRILSARKITYIMLGRADDDPMTYFDSVLDLKRNGTWEWHANGSRKKLEEQAVE